jgi:tetratricopeptide (TPR) repeat protein
MMVSGICVLLAVIIWMVFGQTLGHEFINYDDYTYVVDNAEVTKGLTLHGIGWAFTHSVSDNWHPLTMISHMLDYQLYGLKAGGHHGTNVVLHVLAAVLLFLVLLEMTGGPSSPRDESVRSADRTGNIWRSAFVAALFAIHPLHVESVAWASERKDVLSGVFFMLTLAAYLRYVRKPSLPRYLLVALMFALGLMSKPMLVTLPFVLLLLDYWPLGRVQRSEDGGQPPAQSGLRPGGRSDVGGEERSKRPTLNAQRSTSNEEQRTEDSSPRRSLARRREVSGQHLILEKIPFLFLSTASCVATLVVQRQSMSSVEALPVWVRVYQAFVSCVTYIHQMFWPTKLALFYPYPRGALSIWPFACALMLLLGITALAFKLRKQRPYFITGWLWYLGMLVPVSGIIQVGIQARGDRYTYLPQIGLYLLVTWAIADLSVSWRHRREILGVGAAITILVLAWRAWVQTSYWKNSESLWSHTIAVTPNNATAQRNLGSLLLKRRQLDDAIFHLQASLKIRPDAGPGRNDRDNARVHYNLGKALDQKGLMNEAASHYRKAVELWPDYADGQYNLGMALFREGRVDEAIACWQKSLELAPQSPVTLNSLAWVLSTSSNAELRNGFRAVQLAEHANQLVGGTEPVFIRTLAAAYAEAGRFEDAIGTARKASELAVAKGDSALASELRMDIDLYRMNFPRR